MVILILFFFYKIPNMKTLILLLFASVIYSQNTNTEMAFYNIGMGGLGAGIGAIINKNKNDKTGKVFLKGLIQGSLGGVIVYGSKQRLSRITRKGRLEHAWEAKILNSAGISIIENAALNKDFWERWHFNIGFNRFEFHIKNKFKFKYKIMPVSLTMTAITAFNNKFDLNTSLRTGELVFSNESLPESFGFEVTGYSLGNIIVLRENIMDFESVLTHELVHTFQYYDFNYVNTYFNKAKNELTENLFLNKLNNIFYLDTQGAVFRGLYLLENINRKAYSDNFFENEAAFYSNTPNIILN